MKSTAKRNIYFFYGLIPGIIIGIGLSILIFDISFSKDSIINNKVKQAKVVERIDKKEDTVKRIPEKKISKKKIYKRKDIEVSKLEEKTDDSIANVDDEYFDTLYISDMDSISDTLEYDNLLYDSAITAANMYADTAIIDTFTSTDFDPDSDYYDDFDETIVIRRDELIDIRSALIDGMPANPDAHLDSLLSSDGSGTDKNSNIFRVELWRSPVNYQGYKLAKNKVILFGISQYDSLAFRYTNDSILLEYMSKLYFLEADENFRQLIPLHHLKSTKTEAN